MKNPLKRDRNGETLVDEWVFYGHSDEQGPIIDFMKAAKGNGATHVFVRNSVRASTAHEISNPQSLQARLSEADHDLHRSYLFEFVGDGFRQVDPRNACDGYDWDR